MPMLSSPSFFVLGTRPVATMQASTFRARARPDSSTFGGFIPGRGNRRRTSSVSTSSFVSASIISIVTGLTPGTPGVTFDAKTFVR